MEWKVLDDKYSKTHYLCECVCGKVKPVNKSNVISKKSHSCGCNGLYMVSKKTKRTLTLMVYRCHTETSPDFPNYGGRGIVVCDRWKNSIINFYEDMGNVPDGCTIDRINNDGNYEPSNCRWAINDIQVNNRRSNHRVLYNNEDITMTQFAKKIGMLPSTVRERIQRGWSIEKIASTPIIKKE